MRGWREDPYQAHPGLPGDLIRNHEKRPPEIRATLLEAIVFILACAIIVLACTLVLR